MYLAHIFVYIQLIIIKKRGLHTDNKFFVYNNISQKVILKGSFFLTDAVNIIQILNN